MIKNQLTHFPKKKRQNFVKLHNISTYLAQIYFLYLKSHKPVENTNISWRTQLKVFSIVTEKKNITEQLKKLSVIKARRKLVKWKWFDAIKAQTPKSGSLTSCSQFHEKMAGVKVSRPSVFRVLICYRCHRKCYCDVNPKLVKPVFERIHACAH